MSGDDTPDTSPYKTYTLIQVLDGRRMQFSQNTVPEGRVGLKDGERFNLEVQNENGWDIYPLTGNAYVMNVNGKTISTHMA